MTTAAKVNRAGQSGQALIELVIFLPLMFGVYGIISGFANAINGSINQQKITRAYFYFRIQNSSMVPRPSVNLARDWKKFGMFFIGWADHYSGNEDDHVLPFATCYQITIPLTPATTDNCDNEYTTESTQFIRVGTAYGICGATYGRDNSGNQFFLVPDSLSSDYRELLDISSCLIQQ